MAVLKVEELVTGYGSAAVLQEASLSVGAGEIVALLGPNGAGKTTTLRTIAGILQPWRGEVTVEGRPTKGMSPEAICALGIQFIPEAGGVLRGLTVAENLQLAAWFQRRRRAEVAHRLEAAFETFPRLAQRRKQSASTLSGGERQMLALAQVVMTESKTVLIDEASLGLAPMWTEIVFESIRGLRAAGRSILLVEQNTAKALQIADRAYVMEKGRMVAEGAAAELAKQDDLRELYFGETPPAPDASTRSKRRTPLRKRRT